MFLAIRVRSILKELRDEVTYAIHKHVTQLFFILPKNQSHTKKLTDQLRQKGKNENPEPSRKFSIQLACMLNLKKKNSDEIPAQRHE